MHGRLPEQSTTCSGPELDAGDYTLVYGDRTKAFSLPADEICSCGPGSALGSPC